MENTPREIILSIFRHLKIIDRIPLMLSSKYLFDIYCGKLRKYRIKSNLKTLMFISYIINDNAKMLQWYIGHGVKINWDDIFEKAIKYNSDKCIEMIEKDSLNDINQLHLAIRNLENEEVLKSLKQGIKHPYIIRKLVKMRDDRIIEIFYKISPKNYYFEKLNYEDLVYLHKYFKTNNDAKRLKIIIRELGLLFIKNNDIESYKQWSCSIKLLTRPVTNNINYDTAIYLINNGLFKNSYRWFLSYDRIDVLEYIRDKFGVNSLEHISGCLIVKYNFANIIWLHNNGILNDIVKISAVVVRRGTIKEIKWLFKNGYNFVINDDDIIFSNNLEKIKWYIDKYLKDINNFIDKLFKFANERILLKTLKYIDQSELNYILKPEYLAVTVYKFYIRVNRWILRHDFNKTSMIFRVGLIRDRVFAEYWLKKSYPIYDEDIIYVTQSGKIDLSKVRENKKHLINSIRDFLRGYILPT